MAIAGAVSALGACGDTEGVDRVSLVPVATDRGASWDWTAECRVGPHGGRGCEPAGPAVGTAQLAGNAWTLGGDATAGSLRMAVADAGALQVASDLASAPPCTAPGCIAPEANTWVRGYPSVLYGIDQCSAATSPPQAAELPLPAKLTALPSLVASTTYDARAEGVTHDVAYDLWLNPSDTRSPCRTDGTLEVMLWTDYDEASMLPETMKVGSASVPFAIDGAADAGTDAYGVYVSNIFPNGGTAPWGGTVWLVPDARDRVPGGTVSVDLGAALRAVGDLLERTYGWHDVAGTYWLDTLAFGMEFGPHDPNPYGGGPAPFAFQLDAYCLLTGTTVSAARC
jgi:hypothetical protein